MPKISAMSAAAALTGTEVLPVVQSGATVKATTQDVADLANAYTDAQLAGFPGVADGDKGDIVVSASGAVWSFDSAVVTVAGRAILDDADAAAQRATLGLVIGTDVQAYDADLTTIAGLTATTDNFIQSKAGAWSSRTPAQVVADLPAVVGDAGSGGTKGLVPAPAAGDAAALKFLKADGTWAVPAGGGGSSPTTTKGDMIVRSASADARLPVGADGQELVADSSQALGVKWSDRALKNYLINGNLRWWQRGQSFTALSNGSSPKYTADRWMSWVPGGGSPSYAVTLVAATLAGSAYGLKIQRTAGNSSTNHIHIGQILPASLAKALAGKTVTFALNMKSGVDFSAASSLVKLQVITGTTEDEGGSSYILDTWAGRTVVTNTNKTVSTTMAQAYVTAAIPSTCKEVGFEISWAPVGTAGADDSITIELAQVTIGSVPAAFEVEGDVISLLRCQQFYRKSYNPDVAPGTVTNNGALTWASAVSATGTCYGFVGNLGAPMRVTPTRTAYSPVTGASGNAYQYDAAADVAVTMGSSFNGFQSWAPTKASGDWTSGNRIGIHCVEDAELN